MGSDESNSLVLTVLNRLEAILNEQKSLAQQITALKKALTAHEKKEAKDQDHEEVGRKIQSELDGLISILILLKRKKRLNFLLMKACFQTMHSPKVVSY